MSAEPPPQPEEPSFPSTHTTEDAPLSSEGLLALVQSIVDLIEGSDAHSLEIESGGISIQVRRPTSTPAGGAYLPAALAQAPRGPRREPPSHHQVRAPLTGIWYDAPSPGATPYVKAGSQVEIGSIIGLIETMKIFNEIASDATGRVIQLHAHRGDLVTANTALISVDLSETAAAGPHRG